MSVLRRVHLRTLLREFKPVDAREEAHRSAMLSLCNAPGDPFSRDHWYPGHFTSSAFVISPDNRDVLLIFHEKFERWMQPGGHIEANDVTVITGALREVAEETGIAGVDVIGEGIFDLDVHEIPARKGDPAHHHYDIRVLLRATRREFVAATDALAAKWVPLDSVDTIESDESVMRAVRKIRRVVGHPSPKTVGTVSPPTPSTSVVANPPALSEAATAVASGLKPAGAPRSRSRAKSGGKLKGSA